MGRWFALGLLTGCLLAAALVYRDVIAVPSRWNPWAPLSIADPPNLLTRYKLGRLSSDAAACRATLDEAQMRYTPLPDRRTGAGCGFDNAVRIEQTSARIGEPFALSCRSAVALALWERYELQPAAQRHFGSTVARLEHFGSYACRNVYGRDDDRRSQHATADALDVAGFVLANGHRIRVRSEWGSGDRDAAFLRDVHAGACRFFDAVLGPEYNAAHRDHLHLDRGAFRVCR
jgi:hypothetical protein